MEWRKLQRTLDNYGLEKSLKDIVFKYGDIVLEPNNVTEVSEDSKTLTIHLRSLTKANPEGITPKWDMDKSSKKSQTQAVREYLLQGHTLTPLEALEKFGCFRLSAIIYTLKHVDGMPIGMDNRIDDRSRKKYATYYLKIAEK